MSCKKNNNFCPQPQSLQHVQLFVSEGFDLSLNNTYLLPSSPYTPPPSPAPLLLSAPDQLEVLRRLTVI